MLKKKDLSKHFEDLTKIEIKKHNDQILASNLALNNLKDNISAYENNLSAFRISLNNEVGKVKKELEKQFISIFDKLNEVNSDIEEKTKVSDRKDKYFEDSIENKVSVDIHKKEMAVIREIIEVNKTKLNQKLDTSINSLKDSLQLMVNTINAQLKQITSDLYKTPSESQIVKNDLSTQISTIKIEIDGIRRELQIMRKTDFIQEKHLEDIYNIIKRMEQK